MRQFQFSFARTPLFYGGDLAQGKRKTQRPLAVKRPIHLVLKSKRGLLPRRAQIVRATERLADKFRIKIYSFAVALDHVHLVIKIPGKREYIAFIRALTGVLARTFGKGLWAVLPFSRIVSWGRDFLQLLKYLEQNRKEASGEVPYKKRKNYYK